MKTRGAIVTAAGKPMEIVELDLDGPRQDELLVRMVASGLCHSDDHIATGDLPVATYPMCMGHEGAGIVEEVGPHTSGWQPGDKVVFSMLPGCGRCRFCARGLQNLCQLGATLMVGCRPDDPTSFRMSLDGEPVGQFCGISTFSEYSTVSVNSAIKVREDTPLEQACLLSCGVPTGWGSAVNAADIYPGDTVIVMGVGGIGMSAVQGASHSGAGHVIAVDPVAFKRDAALRLGAHHAVASIEEATDLAASFTDGQGADSAIVTTGIVRGEHIATAFKAVRKAGTLVVTGMAPVGDTDFPISAFELSMFQKTIKGTLFGRASPSVDIPLMLDLYRNGQLKLDEMITTTYSLDDITTGYDDMKAGRNIRGVVVF